jgi:hypothetical protein
MEIEEDPTTKKPECYIFTTRAMQKKKLPHKYLSFVRGLPFAQKINKPHTAEEEEEEEEKSKQSPKPRG